MAFLNKKDIVLIDQLMFENFMSYREKRKLKNDWPWMTLPSGTMMEVRELIFRTTGRRRYPKINKPEDSQEPKPRARRSWWVKCSVITPLEMVGQEFVIPGWILRPALVNTIRAKESA